MGAILGTLKGLDAHIAVPGQSHEISIVCKLAKLANAWVWPMPAKPEQKTWSSMLLQLLELLT